MSISPGTKLGRYEIRSQLGAGGMGEVYLAHDTQLDRSIALKILPAEVAADPQRLRRFHQEARAASALNHPHIAHIYEIGEHEGQHFIAMEHVEGLPLNARIGGGPLAISEIVQLGIQLADALDEAHSKGVTHRDIKPSNIVVTPRGQAKLLDFGLAKLRLSIEQEKLTDASTQMKTAPGVVMGTVMYMSPEQALGQVVDHRSDIFSMGALLYEMATGRLPFQGSTATEIIDHIAHAQPEAISRFNYNVPADLERIIRKCLEKDKERRYQSARELLVDLENLKRDSTEGVVADKNPPLQQSNVNRWTLGALALLIMALAGVGIYLFKHRGQPAEMAAIDSIAVLPLVNASNDANMEYLSDGITESIINSLSQLPQLRVVPRVSAFRYKGRQIDPQAIGREMGVRAVLTGRVVQVGENLSIQTELIDVNTDSQLWGQKYNRKLSDILTLEDEIASQISDKLRLKLTGPEHQQVVKRYTQNTEAYQLYLKGRYYWKKYTKDGAEKSIEYFNKAIEKDPTYALAYSSLADAYVVLGVLYLPPKETFPKARDAGEKALAIDESLAAGHISMGAYKLFYEWDWSAAR
jgi:eukaryotic-like serine/threonine-protein kinase